MQIKLNYKSTFYSWQALLLFVVFFGARFLSFFVYQNSILQALVVFGLLMLLGGVYFKNPTWAWYIVTAELFLGGSGHLFEFFGLSIRTTFIIAFMFLWTIQQIGVGQLIKKIKFDKIFFLILTATFVAVIFSIINGISTGHDFRAIVADAIPYLFLLFTYPGFHMATNKKNYTFLTRLLIIFIFCSAILSIFYFACFSSGILEIHEPVYNWIRDAAMGKITHMGQNFYRVVLPEHLFIVPLTLIIASLLNRDEKHNIVWYILLVAALIIIVLNLSRAYLLGLFVGLVILKYKHKWHRYAIITSSTIGLLILIFTFCSLLASGGKTLGWEVFGVRLASLATPGVETSTATRMMILPSALKLAKDNFFLGNGLGASVSYYNDLEHRTVTTGHFDWGYIEQVAEMGILGTLIYLSLIFYICFRLIKKIRHLTDWHDFYVGALAAIAALLIINIAAPTIFHVLGILTISLIAIIALKPDEIFEKLINYLYRIFNKLKV